MGVRIRLSRMGSTKRPFYRIVVADSRAPRDGKFVEVIGTYNPRTEPVGVQVNSERLQKWLKQGAEPTDTVRSLLKKKGLLAKPA
ncbi:MAG TPA: 30S ribosomal protein S16 [Syntrophobacteria bacterium]|nr:30S ribosomal protein S16 [Syntrophobacteria bacterium]